MAFFIFWAYLSIPRCYAKQNPIAHNETDLKHAFCAVEIESSAVLNICLFC